jgi:hypothetical protein
MIRDGKINGAYEKKGRRYLIYPVKADTLLKSYDVSEAASSLPRHSIADANQSGSNFKPISFAEAARREKLAKAALLELQLKRECGELIDRKRVLEAAAKIGSQVRVGLEAIPSKVAPVLAGMSSPQDVGKYLTVEVRAVLSDLSKIIANNNFKKPES